MILRFILCSSLCLISTSASAFQSEGESELEYMLLGEESSGSQVVLTASREFLQRETSQRQILMITEIDKAEIDETDFHMIYMMDILVNYYSSSPPRDDARLPLQFGQIGAFWKINQKPWPPQSKTPYYSSDNVREKHLWRSLGWIAPDLIMVWTRGEKYSIGIPEGLPESLLETIQKSEIPTHTLPKTSLASAVTNADPAPAGTGTIPAVEVVIPFKRGVGIYGEVNLEIVLDQIRLLKLLHEANLPEISPAHQELLDRRKRTPLEIARQLDAVYGHDFKSVMYQPALALVGRLELDDLLGETSRRADVERIVADYAAGTKPALGDRPNGSVTSGHLIFSELARRADKAKYLPLVVKAADQGFADDGTLLEAMPAHYEMSDSVFMGGPILAAAGRLTGDEKYYEMCLKHVRFMQQHCLREDGLYRHSPLDEAAWGRGNGFPALGLAWTISELPADHPVHKELVIDLRNHLKALVKHQDPTGMWQQVIDEPGSYREMTATCMITFAMLRGLREGWFDERDFLPAVKAAWPAIQDRISPQGELIDVCTGTGKQKSLQAYFDRPAILGRDERGGAMALLVVTEYARWSDK
jgi:unsaturated rhamnogalacturonyl hydrolase